MRTYFARDFEARGITDFFNISTWIMNFVCFYVQIAEIMREQVSDRSARSPRVVLVDDWHDGPKVLLHC